MYFTLALRRTCSLFHASEEVSTDYPEVGLNVIFLLKNSTESKRENAKGKECAEQIKEFHIFCFSSPLNRSSSSISRLIFEMPVRGDN